MVKNGENGKETRKVWHIIHWWGGFGVGIWRQLQFPGAQDWSPYLWVIAIGPLTIYGRHERSPGNQEE